ncbi:hypothetical protein [Tepidibacillus marianensis]|uniref:hypothetical protein n=1 Tax=Tepidibacillus marianensis TaxID=3131995 RepID=UPI0030CBC93C
MKNNRGIVQLEMIIVLFIIGILLTMAIPSFRNMQTKSELDHWVDRFLADYYWVQQEAIHTDKWVEIVFSSEGHYYLIRNEKGIIKKVPYEQDIVVTENFLNHRIMFNALGRLAYRNGTIDLKTPKEERHFIIQLVTGQIHVER